MILEIELYLGKRFFKGLKQRTARSSAPVITPEQLTAVLGHSSPDKKGDIKIMDYLELNQPGELIEKGLQQAIEQANRRDGGTDAAFSDSPDKKDPAYLDGYFAEMRRRVEAGEHLEIRWLSESFRTGAYDAPDWFNGGGGF